MALSTSARPVRTAALELAALSGLLRDGAGVLAAAVLAHVDEVRRRAGPALPPDQHDVVRAAGVAMQQALTAATAQLTPLIDGAGGELEVLLRRPRDGPLAAAQREALRHYTTVAGVTELNRYLRDPASTPEPRRAELRRLAGDAIAGLAALPRFTGVAYRGTTLPAEQLERWRPGVVVADRGFASASASAAVAHAFRAGGNTFLTIVGRSGADIRRLSLYEHEAEVLYPPGTRFRVLDRSWDDERGCWSFLLEEVPRCASTATSTTG
ncbi:ADP-ribosyltransferase domain-containing protein [Jiangella anatolica]|uniref:NAD(+)--protein-arginine ADP-ribosyltransferase n=1 Tax=Jiangella anatolica TaxID=2670374 RepID=A0A2W2BCZ9_9ACTN|nr:ADP-ribosyltransferase domain-containing protein [Jiangella anatolica]PZF84975.1 hypothetical protein C1I92_06630 [Jiangella anatolica]